MTPVSPETILHDMGGTYSPTTGESPTRGYAVAVTDSPETPVPLGHEDAARDMVSSWLTSSPVVESLAASAARYIGAWAASIDGTDSLVLDVSEIYQDRNEALAIARARGEQAIYSLHDQEEIYV